MTQRTLAFFRDRLRRVHDQIDENLVYLTCNGADVGESGVEIHLQFSNVLPLVPRDRNDSLDRVITWQGKSDTSLLAGRPVRLRILLRDAELYSFQFRE